MREEGRNMTDCVRDAGWTIPVLYEDNHLLCVEKPANLPVQADSSLDRDLLSILRDYIGRRYEKPGRVYLGLVHRLDRPVGGAMVFAPNVEGRRAAERAVCRAHRSEAVLRRASGRASCGNAA